MAALNCAVFALNTIIVDAHLFFGYNNINAIIIKRKNYRNGEIYQDPILPDTQKDIKLYTVKYTIRFNGNKLWEITEKAYEYMLY